MVDESKEHDTDGLEDEADNEHDTEELEDESDDMHKCVVCGDPISEDDVNDGDSRFVDSDASDSEWFADESKSGDVCQGCIESIESYPNSITVEYGDEEYKFIFNDGIVMDAGNDSDITDVVVDGVRSIVKTEKYVHTDGWRGYVDVSGGDLLVNIEGFNVLWGHHSEQMRVKEDETIKEAFGEIGIPMFKVVTLTSNIFAANADYFVPKEKETEAKNVINFIKDWFETEDWRWNIGVVFSDLQDSPPTKAVLEQIRQKGKIDGVNWAEVAKIEAAEA